jgi:ABC-type uncharacterized transport system ATPase subunit
MVRRAPFAVRDQEERVRFLGYDPANIKIVAYVMAGIADALFVPTVGIISPASVGVVPSIAFLSHVRVVFDGFVAVDGVSMTVLRGDLRFLIGSNGAGKTTLVDAITGLVPATGSVRFGRTELIGKKVHRIAQLGIGRTFQTASVFEELTVLQNLDIAAGSGRNPLLLLRRRSSVPLEVEETLESVGLSNVRDSQAGALALGQKQWLEIGMLLVQNARVLFPALGTLMSRRAGLLSGGQRQQLALARALITQPWMLILDEPIEGIQRPRRAATTCWKRAGSLLPVLVGRTLTSVSGQPWRSRQR